MIEHTHKDIKYIVNYYNYILNRYVEDLNWYVSFNPTFGLFGFIKSKIGNVGGEIYGYSFADWLELLLDRKAYT